LPEQPEALPPVPEASAMAPFIYFDIVPNFGINNGVVALTLEAVRFTLDGPGKVSQGRVTVAHVRTSIEGLRQLKRAIEGIERAIHAVPATPQAQMLPPSPSKAKPN
jgi:hypothetical protein